MGCGSSDGCDVGMVLWLTTTPDSTTAKTAFMAAKVGLFIGVVMGGLYALIVLSDVLSKEPDFNLPGDAVIAGITAFMFYGVLAFVSSGAVIAAWRVIRR